MNNMDLQAVYTPDPRPYPRHHVNDENILIFTIASFDPRTTMLSCILESSAYDCK